IHGSTDGFRITAPADINVRTLKVYVGLYSAEAKFQAYLSDHSAPAYTDTSLRGLTVYDNAYTNYTLEYRAASSGQMLVVEFTAKTLFDADFGNVSLAAAILSGGKVSTNELPAVTITNPVVSSDQLSFSFPTQSNRTYVIEHTTTLSPVNWETLTNLLGDGGVLTAIDSIRAETVQFYRVRTQ